MSQDTFIPFVMDASSRVQPNGSFFDPVLLNAGAISEAGLVTQLGFLRDSLWVDDIGTRFLLQFWVVESLAERHADDMPDDAVTRDAVDDIQEVISAHLPNRVALFKAKKGDILRRTLVEKVTFCLGELRIAYDDAAFKRAKKVRDGISHGTGASEQSLLEAEHYVRDLSRAMLRRELERHGLFLSGTAVHFDQMPVLTVRTTTSTHRR